MNHKSLNIFRIAAMVVLFQLPLVNVVQAQTDEDLDSEYGGRLSLSVDKKLARGLHLALEEEARFDNDFKSFDRFQSTLSLSYKINKSFKVGIGYALINGYSTTDSSFKNSRHRFMADASYGVRFGDWRFSIKERFQMTYRTGEMNEYQNPRTVFGLKSRLKVQYKGFEKLDPYVSLELRNILNAPIIKAYYNGSSYLTSDYTTSGEAGWFLDGFGNIYVNRLRGTLGMDYSWNKRNSISVSLIADYVMDYVVDANADGTELKSYTHQTGFKGWLTAGYKYSF